MQHQQRFSTLIVDLKIGDRLNVSGEAIVEMVRKSGQVARLRVTAPRDVKIARDPATDRRSNDVPSMAQ